AGEPKAFRRNKLEGVGATGLEPVTPSVSSNRPSDASEIGKGVTSSPSLRCTNGCTNEAEATNDDPLAPLAAALLALSDTDRARLAALLTGNPPPARADDFGERFAVVFQRLDQDAGRHNFVSLVPLRQALADVSRDPFDRGLQSLRHAGRYTLSAAEGRGGL